MGGAELVGDENRRLLVGHLDDHAAQPPAAICSTRDCAAARGDVGDQRAAKSGGNRIGGVKGDISCAVSSTARRQAIPTELSKHIGRHRVADRLADDVVHPLRDRDPTPSPAPAPSATARPVAAKPTE